MNLPTLFLIRERVHDYDFDTVKSRIESKKLPGRLSSSSIYD
jgi:hypothetical protein